MNKNILNIRRDVLDDERSTLLPKLVPYTSNFVLAGGTALALQLVHRKSFDFDFFGTSPIPTSFLEKISETIAVDHVAVDSTDELTFFTQGQVKVTFLSYPFKHAFELVELENGLKLFSVPDIAIQKAYTIGRRGEYRDYFDLYTILKNDQMKFAQLIQKAKQVYGNIFDEKIFLQQLIYFGDLLSFDIIPIAETQLPTPQAVKQFFEELVNAHI